MTIQHVWVIACCLILAFVAWRGCCEEYIGWKQYGNSDRRSFAIGALFVCIICLCCAFAIAIIPFL